MGSVPIGLDDHTRALDDNTGASTIHNTAIHTAALLALILAGLLPRSAHPQSWQMKPVSTATRWAASVSPTNALPEYPRPQLVRASWQNLNGLWDYAITAQDAPVPRQYAGQILVPFPLESALSGVQGALQADERLWYRRTFTLEFDSSGARTLLHFGAVDFEATVYLNGTEVGRHRGGYEHFCLEITAALKAGENELVVKVWDPTDAGPNPHGKQGYQHTASSGIWQTVWLERVPQSYIQALKMTPDVDHNALALEVNLDNAQPGDQVEAIAREGSAVVSRARFTGNTTLHFTHPHLWSPDHPSLYDLEVRLLRGQTVIDRVTSYFGLRKIEVKADAAGRPRIFLNNRFTYQLGTLDRGWWPDGLYTAPTDAALKFDIQVTQAAGFNTIRKHVKVEPDRWYYHCDTLGVLVWQDMVNPARFNPEALSKASRAQFESEVRDTVTQLYNHPSIVQWVLFNEGWGAYDQARLSRQIKDLDPFRLLDAHSGPEANQVDLARWLRQQDPAVPFNSEAFESYYGEGIQRALISGGWAGGEVIDVHHYPDPRMPPAQAGKAQLLGEHGGVGVRIEGHLWDEWMPGYSFLDSSPDQIGRVYAGYVQRLKPLEAQGLSGSIYTNPFDVEGAEYGLMTYDRAVTKIPLAQLAQLNSELVPRAQNANRAAREVSIADADPTPEAQRYAALLEDYQHGRRDDLFAERLTLMALRQKDPPHATQIGNAVIARFEQPYSPAAWSFIRAATATSKDSGFAALRSQAAAADAALGPNAAEVAIRRIITREELEPARADPTRSPPWTSIEPQVQREYGALGTEAVAGARMMDAEAHQDWPDFGRNFARYFETAATRSEYPIEALAWRVCQHVDDPQALDAAITTLRWDMELSTGVYLQGKENPFELDTYACILYQRGRTLDALAAQERAVQLSAGEDAQINRHLLHIKAGEPLWDHPGRPSSRCAGRGGVHYLCGLGNSEDLIAVPDSPWIVASGLADANGLGGGLYLIDRRDDSWKTLYPDIVPRYSDTPAPRSGDRDSDCQKPVDALHFSAHGIHLRIGAQHRDTLYVVNHGSRESIEVFELDVEPTPTLQWKGCLMLPGNAVANSVVSLPEGGVAVTVMFLSTDTHLEQEVAHGEKTGYVLEWHSGEGWKPLPGSEGSFPNGIEVSPDGHWLYITNTGEKNVVRLSRGVEPVQKKAVTVGFSTDNLRWSPDHRLLVTGQLSGCGSEIVCSAPYEILELDPGTLKYKPLPHAPTAPEFGAASTTLMIGSELWVGTYLGDRIARLPLPH